MDRAALYCRLSKEDLDKIGKGDDSESIQNQKLLLTDFATEHNMLIYRFYIDDDYSGTDKDRPGWNRMLSDAEKGEFNVIICKSQSRFTRDMEIAEKYLNGLFIEWGIRFIGAVDGVDTSIKANKKARQINGLVNEWYIEELSENIKAVFRKKMEAGQFLGSFACYGYKKDPKDRHKLLVDKEAARVVRRIYDLYLQGYSVKHIADILTEDKLPTPTQYKCSLGYKYKNNNADAFSVKYGIWSQSTVKRILTDESYTGSLVQGREKKLSYKSKKVVTVPENEWIRIKNNHEAIIDLTDFKRVQQLMRSKRTVSNNCKTAENNCSIEGQDNTGSENNPGHIGATANEGNKSIMNNKSKEVNKGNTRGTKTKAHILAGKVKCKACGSGMIKTGGSSPGRQAYIRCQLANKSRNKECSSHTISLNKLIELVSNEIHCLTDSVLATEENIAILESILKDPTSNEKKLSIKQQELMNIADRIDDIGRAAAVLYIDKVKGIVTEEMYISHSYNFEKDLSRLRAEQDKVRSEIEDLQQEATLQKDTFALVKEYMHFEELSHETVYEFVDHIEIGEKDRYGNRDIQIYWNV